MSKNSNLRKRAFRVGYYFDMYSTHQDDWEEEAKFNMALNPECIEIMLEYPGSVSDFLPSHCRVLQKLLPGVPLSAHAPTLNYSLISTSRLIQEASVQEHLLALDVAKSLGSKIFTLHAGAYPFFAHHRGLSPAKIFNKVIPEISEKANRLGIEVLVENMGGAPQFPNSFEEIDEIFEANPTLKMALDTRHFVQAGLNPTKGFLRYAERVRTIQFRLDGRMTDLQIKDFLEALLDKDYAGIFIIEDKALTQLDKSNKDQIIAGRQTVDRLLGDLGALALA